MYYDNKSTFYIKQYGPAVFVIIISLVLVLSGLYVYLSSNRNNRPQDTLVAKNNTVQEQSNAEQNIENLNQSNSLQQVEETSEKKEEIANEANTTTNEEVKTTVTMEEVNQINLNDVKISNVLTSELRALSKLQKSKEFTVLGVTDDKEIIVNISNNNYKVDLIGIDYKKSPSNIKDTISNDLTNKKITLAFDNVKLENSKLYAYVYINNELYNQNLLKNGLATLKIEKANTSLLNDLVNSQKYAKENNLGIWKK